MTATWQGPSLCDLLTQNGHRHKSFNTSAVVRRLIASCHNQPNAFGAKLLVPTSLLLTNWRTLLSNYSDKIVVDFLPYGWPINYTTSTLPASSLHNHPSASHFDSHVQAYIDTELAWNAIARPLEYLPFFDDFVCSPLQTVAKRGSPTWRVVMDLSFLQAAPSMTVFLKILIWGKILSYNYPRLIGLSNSLLRKVATVCFQKRLVQSLLSVSHWSKGLPFTRLSLSGQILFCHSSFQFTFVSTDFPMHNKGGCPYLPQAGVLSRCLSWWLLWRRISLSCCFGIFSTQPVTSSTWFGFCSWQGFTTFDLYDLSHSRLPSRGSYW